MYSPALPSSPNRQPSSWLCSKWRPTTVTTWPAVLLRPHDGTSPSTVAPISYMYILPSLVKSAPSFKLTSTVTGPLVPSAAPGATHDTIVDENQTAPVLVVTLDSPKRHCRPSPSRKPEPVTSTVVPPTSTPRQGDTPITLGASKNVKGEPPPISAPSIPSSRVSITTPSLVIQGVTHSTVVTFNRLLPTISGPNLHRTTSMSICVPDTSTTTVVPPLTGPAEGVVLNTGSCHAT